MTSCAPVSIEVTVAWGDMDSFNHVNNIIYLKWFESARIRLFEQVGVLKEMQTRGIGPILARSTCDYLKPVSYPDTIRVEAWCTRLGTSSFDLSYEAYSTVLGAACARGDSTVVMVDYHRGGSVVLSDALRSELSELTLDKD